MNNTTPEQLRAMAMQMHGQDWGGFNLTGWVITEKMDGCRAYWDGKTLYTKSGNVINAPDITARLPRWMHLDGEIWAGRGGFETARLFVQYGKPSPHVRFVAFDAPGRPGGQAQRLDAARATGVRCVDYTIVSTMRGLRQALEQALSHGAEGFMASAPNRPYVSGRSRYLAKLKSFSLELFKGVAA